MSAKVHFLPRAEPVAHADTLPLITVPATAVCAARRPQCGVYGGQRDAAVENPGRDRPGHVGSGIAVCCRAGRWGTQVIDSVDDRVRRGVKVKVP